MSQTFDYIIVGGGTAGLTVANRLTEDENVKVLVIEAGPDNSHDPFVATPGLLSALYGNPKHDWNFNSVPQPFLNNRKINNPRGKQLGGSSTLNFMLLVYPSRISIDSWEKLGNAGWNYASLEPYLEKFSTIHAPSSHVGKYAELSHHDESIRSKGPVQGSFDEGNELMASRWVDSFSQLGIEMKDDMRRGNIMGAFKQPTSIDPATKTRSHAASAYYTPDVSKRPNLTVLTESVVKKLIFDHSGPEPVAKGVNVEGADKTDTVFHASAEVILAAGSLMTPQILELSGIGQRELLESHGIPVIVENASIGENLQDHPLTCQSFEVKAGIQSTDVFRNPELVQKAMEEYQTSRGGPLGQCNALVAFAPLSDASGVLSAEARKEFFLANEQNLQSQDGEILRQLLEAGDEPATEYMFFPSQLDTGHADPSNMADYFKPARPENYISVFSMLNHSFSRGSVHITSPDVHQLPKWDPSFGHPLDIEVAARHVQFVEKLVSTKPFSDIIKPGGARIPKASVGTIEEAKEVVRSTQISCSHQAGSCSMRPRENGGVVDDRLRVYGVKGLRVVDASIIPLEPSGNIQSVVYAVAEKAADLIKADRQGN